MALFNQHDDEQINQARLRAIRHKLALLGLLSTMATLGIAMGAVVVHDW